MESGYRGRQPNSTAQMRRAALGHPVLSPGKLAGLMDRRIDAYESNQFLWLRETGNISNFTENYSPQNLTHARTGGNAGIQFIHALLDLKVQFIQLPLQQIYHFQKLPQLQSKR